MGRTKNPKEDNFFNTRTKIIYVKRKSIFYKKIFTFLMVMVAQGGKWSGCTPTLLDVHALGQLACDHNSGFSVYQLGESDPSERNK